MRAIAIIFALLCAGITAQSQIVLDQTNADCSGTVLIEDSIFGPTPRATSFGNVLEIKENSKEDKRYFEREHNTTWYKFRVPWDCDFTFDIIPENTKDDFDFMLFEAGVVNFCEKVLTKSHGPIRSNISRNDPNDGSLCGLSKEASEDFVRSGIGTAYSRSVQAEKGQLFYLVVDNPKRPLTGYTIHFHYGQDPNTEPEADKVVPSQVLNIKIVDSRTGQPLVADLGIEGVVFSQVYLAKGKSEYEIPVDSYRKFKIACVKKGYMFFNLELSPSLDPVYNAEVRLDPIEAGSSITLDNIEFVGNKSTVKRASEISLFQLMNFLLENESVKIEIQGHVNGPTYKNKKEFVELSTSRAKSIFDFLLVNDIEPDRMTYKGFGNSAMIYPNPKKSEESEANRRVEIRIVSN